VNYVAQQFEDYFDPYYFIKHIPPLDEAQRNRQAVLSRIFNQHFLQLNFIKFLSSFKSFKNISKQLAFEHILSPFTILSKDFPTRFKYFPTTCIVLTICLVDNFQALFQQFASIFQQFSSPFPTIYKHFLTFCEYFPTACNYFATIFKPFCI